MNPRQAYLKSEKSRLCQGDILSDVSFPEQLIARGGEISVTQRILPYAIVLSQDCDLEQDFSNRKAEAGNHDKYLPSIIVSPAYPAEMLRLGKHLENVKQAMQNIDSKRFKQLKQNNLYRYHYLHSSVACELPELGVPELIIDFKHYFTIPRDVAYKDSLSLRVASLNELFRENLSQRFYYFMNRIGLPDTIEE